MHFPKLNTIHDKNAMQTRIRRKYSQSDKKYP